MDDNNERINNKQKRNVQLFYILTNTTLIIHLFHLKLDIFV